MAAAVVTLLEALGALLVAAGVGVAAAAFVPGVAGVGLGLFLSGAVVLVAAAVAAR